MKTFRKNIPGLITSLLLFAAHMILPAKTISAEIMSISFEDLSKELINNIPESAIKILGEPDKDEIVLDWTNPSKSYRLIIYDWELTKKPCNIISYDYEGKRYAKYDYIRIKIINGKIVHVTGPNYYILSK
jgi:hypothetical protein